MSYFVGVTSVHQLKIEYRRLAAKYHPDRGGDSRQMQEINAFYEHVRKKLKRLEKQQAARQKAYRHKSPVSQKQTVNPSEKPFTKTGENSAIDFRRVKMGETVFVNGTEGEVTEVGRSSFRVVAKGRARQAIFNKNGGKGKYNKGLNASYDNRHRKRGFSAVV